METNFLGCFQHIQTQSESVSRTFEIDVFNTGDTSISTSGRAF